MLMRLQNEAKVIRDAHAKKLSLQVQNSKEWRITFRGPFDEPYKGRFFTGQLLFSSDYPKVPPLVSFIDAEQECGFRGEKKRAKADLIKLLFERLPWKPSFGVSHICLNLMEIMESDVDGQFLEDVDSDKKQSFSGSLQPAQKESDEIKEEDAK